MPTRRPTGGTMPEQVATLHPVITWSVAIILTTGAVATAWKKALGPIFKRLRAAWKALEEFIDDWNGEPAQPARPGKPAVPERHGVLARLDHQRDSLEQIRHEVLPNNGGSLRDAVDDLDIRLDDLDRRLTAHVTASEREHADTRQAIEALQDEQPHATTVVNVNPQEDT